MAALISSCLAESPGIPKWTLTTITKVKPEMRQEFETCLKQMAAAYKKAGSPWFQTFETFAGDTTEYTTVVPVMKFGDLDAPPVLTKVLGKAEWQRLSGRLARCYTAQTCQYATPQAELEIDRDVPVGTYWVETRTFVAPGKMADYLNWLANDYRPALEKAGVRRFRVLQPIFGAAAGEIVTMRVLENLAEIDRGSVLSKALSDGEVRVLVAKPTPLVNSSQTRIIRMRAELSYNEQPPAPDIREGAVRLTTRR